MATYYFRNTGDANWGTASNWSATDGGGATGAIPTTSDDVFFTSNSGNCSLNANRVCKSIDFTGYTNVLSMATFTLSVSGNITFQSTQSSRISGTTGRLISAASGTITSNGGSWPLDYQIANVTSINITFADNMRILGSYIGAGGGTQTLTGSFNIYVSTNITSTGTISSTSTNFIMNGSGTYSGSASCNLEIDTTGTIIITGSVAFTRRFIITNVGSITMTAANVTIGNTTTVDLGGRTIGNLTHGFSLTSTVTYLSDVYCNNFTIGNGSATYNGPGKIYASGNYAFSGFSSGTLVVELIGSGTIGTGSIGLVTIINCSGTYTLGATLTIGNTFTYTSGTFNTATSTVTLGSGISITSGPINWYNITVNTGTITLNDHLNVINNLSVAVTANIGFNGTGSWTCANLLAPAAGKVITLQELLTYTTTTSVNMLGTDASKITMISSSATNRAIWTLLSSASQSVVYVNGTRIDSSAGQTIWSFGGTLTSTLNWNIGSKPNTTAWTYLF